MNHYYNEYDKKAAAWLRELIKGGLIPDGEVDTRSIVDVQPADIIRFTQCHFFAGIGGWAYALQRAGWPADKPVWTGSCPCQPYSTAGKGKGNDDERNLWPHFYRLIRECRPDTVFGEQVASAIRFGWLDGVQSDLEKENYAVGHCVLGAHSVNAPHQRQRLYWMAHGGHSTGRTEQGNELQECCGGVREPRSSANGLEKSEQLRRRRWGKRPDEREIQELRLSEVQAERYSGLANNNNKGSQGRNGEELSERERQRSPWEDSTSVLRRDGKRSRIPATVESLFQCLADGLPYGMDERGAEYGYPLAGKVKNRTMLLKGYGNAICVPVAAEFIKAFMEGVGK